MPEQESAISKLSELFVRYALLAIAFATPLFLIPVGWSTVSQSKMLLVGAIAILAITAWLVGSVAGRKLYHSIDPIIFAAFFLPLVYILSAVFVGTASSFVSGDAIQGTVASMALLFGILVLSASVVRERHVSVTVLSTLLWSGAGVLVFQAARLAFPSMDLFGALPNTTSSLVGSWHDLGIFAGVILLISSALLESAVASTRVRTILLQVLALASLLMLVVVNFSDIWFAVAGGSAVFAYLRASRVFKSQRNVMAAARYSIFWIVLAIVALGIGFGGSFIYNTLPSALQISQVEVRPSWEGTFAAGQQVFEGGKTLVFGTGPNTFDTQWARFKPTEVNATNFWNVDFQSGIGIVPTALVTVGVLGSIAWALLIFALLWAGYTCFKSENDVRLRALLFVTSAFLMTFHIIYVPGIAISILMFMLLGILAGLNAGKWRVAELQFAPKNVVVFGIALIVVCGVVGTSLLETRSIASTLMTYRAAQEYNRTNDANVASAMISDAIKVDPSNDIAQRAAIEIGLLQFRKLVESGASDTATRDQLQQTLSNTISHGLAAVSIDSTNYQNWLALAGLYQSLAGVGIQGAYEQAQQAYLKAASTTPSNPIPFVQLGQLAMVQSKNDEALAHFTKAIELKPNLALPYYLRSQIEASRAKYEDAVRDAYAAAQIANQDPIGWYNLGIILYAAGDYQNAAISLEKAVSLQNNYSDALFALAIDYDKLGMRDKALEAAQKVASLNPNEAVARAILDNISAGRSALEGLNGQSSNSQTQSSPKK